MKDLEITEKLLKDSLIRNAPLSADIDKVVIDLRSDTHDIIKVNIRGMPCGQLVTDKNDSVTIARRLLPESLKYGKEPSTLVHNMEMLGTAYMVLETEVRLAINSGSITSLAAYMRKLDADRDSGNSLPGDGHLFLTPGMARSQREGEKHPPASPREHSNR